MLLPLVVAVCSVAPAVTRAAQSACQSALASYSDTAESARLLISQDEDLSSLHSEEVADPQVLTDYADDLDELTSLVAADGATCTDTSTASLLHSRDELTSAEDELSAATDSATTSAEDVRASRAQQEIETVVSTVSAQLTLASTTLSSLTATTTASTSLSELVEEATSFVDSHTTGEVTGEEVSTVDAVTAEGQELADSLSEARIRAEVSDIIGSTRVGIDIVDLATGDAVFQVNAEETFTTASTYKLFVASAMADAVESGDLTWSSAFDGVTLGECLSQMILVSDNSSPETWLQTYGYQTLEDLAHDLGATHTSLRYADLTTTPTDMTTLLTSLHDGTLMDSADTAQLISLMQQQEYRDGLGTLEPEATVADKVGWLDGIRNDVGIVSSDEGDYAFAIYTEQSQWSMVADIAQAIYDWLGERP